MTSRLPNMIVVGAPRCGTTSIFQYLRQHPEIYLPVRKELHYFSYLSLEKNSSGPGDKGVLETLCKDIDQYRTHYQDVKMEKIVGEVSPSYLYYSNVGEKIQRELGQVKIIVSLRNPIEKAYSQYMHLVRLDLEPLDFYAALQAERERMNQHWGDIWRYAESSLYADRIEAYMQRFGRENVHITSLEKFASDPNGAISDIFTFLKVDPSFVPDMRVYNRSGNPRFKMVGQFFARPNALKSMIKQIVPERIRVPLRLSILNWNSLEKDEMDANAKAFLIDYFKEDDQKLEALLGRPTPWMLR